MESKGREEPQLTGLITRVGYVGRGEVGMEIAYFGRWMEDRGAIVSTYIVQEDKLDRFWGRTDDKFGFRHVKWRFMWVI